VPFVKPVNVQERLVVFVHNAGAVTAGEEVTVYPVIALPPLDPGALQLTTDDAFATVPETFVGAPGAVGAATETSLVAIDGDEAPLAFVATTTNLYVPFAKPLTVQVVAVVVVHVERPGNAVTVYPVIALPPSGGAVQLTVAELFELTPVGGCGA
jgi:hypothetical protein